MNARSRSWPGSQASPLAHSVTAVAKLTHTWAFQALVSWRTVCMKRGELLNTGRMVLWSGRSIYRHQEGVTANHPLVSFGDTFETNEMSTTQDLITALKAELRRAGITYAQLA